MNLENKMEIKTLDGWHQFAEENKEGSWDKYCKPGDLVDEEVYDYFLDILPPHSMKRGYLQVGEPYSHRQNPATGKWQATFSTFVQVGKGVWRWCGNCFSGGLFDADAIGEAKTLQEFMKATYRVNLGMQETRPRIVCKDGFNMSVQAGVALYSNPRENLESGEYKAYEIGFPSQEEELLKPFSEEDKDYTQQVYAFVPAETVEQIIEKHGGFA